jgi:hypothetical protein
VSPSELANRFSNYADAVVAFAVLNAIGFMSAVAEEDTRSAISEAPNLVFLFSLLGAVCFYTVLAVVFRYTELNLREEAGEVSKPMVDRYQRYFQIARISVIWLSNGTTLLIYFGMS